jgi:hypothetical protein
MLRGIFFCNCIKIKNNKKIVAIHNVIDYNNPETNSGNGDIDKYGKD